MPDRRILVDRVFAGIVVALGLLAVLPLFHIVFSVLVEGAKAIAVAGPGFFTQPPAPPGAPTPGGIGPALAGTVVLAVLSTLLGIPLAFLTGVFLAEFRETRLARITRGFVMSLLEVPTILVGMLVYTLIVVPMGGYSLLAGSIALALVLLPYVSTYVERALERVPETYREAGYALGLTRPQVVFRILVGVARKGILAGLLIGFAKAVGETAPLLFTIGGARSGVNMNPLAPGDAVPLLVFQYAMTPYENWVMAAWGASLVLLLVVLAVYAAAHLAVGEVEV